MRQQEVISELISYTPLPSKLIFSRKKVKRKCSQFIKSEVESLISSHPFWLKMKPDSVLNK